MNGVKIRELLRFFCASHYNFGYFHLTPKVNSLEFTQLAAVLNVCASAITHSLGQTLDLIADSVRPSVRPLVSRPSSRSLPSLAAALLPPAIGDFICGSAIAQDLERTAPGRTWK